jgi:galactose mutarotase-like enzyme
MLMLTRAPLAKYSGIPPLPMVASRRDVMNQNHAIALIQSSQIRAGISSLGAELVWLRDAQGRNLLWNGDDKWWAGRSPLLFPLVGRVPRDLILVEGETYSIPQHGFARRSKFEIVESTSSSCTHRMTSDEGTLELYPFKFTLDITYTVQDASLKVAALLRNEDHFGLHPVWMTPA